jgi:hypothetical protein
MINGLLINGFGHPEGGHIIVKRCPRDQENGFKGPC